MPLCCLNLIHMYYRNLWEKAVETDTPECKGTVPNLIEGMEYQFRIIAVNRAGPGEASEPCRPVTAKPRFCKFVCLPLLPQNILLYVFVRICS